MANKLDLLAQKEQQLRQLNDQLDMKKSGLLNAKLDEPEEDAYPDEGMDDYEESKQKPNDDSYEYEADGFEESTHKSKTIAALMNLGQQSPGGKEDYGYSMSGGGAQDRQMQMYQDDSAKVEEQEKTIQF